MSGAPNYSSLSAGEFYVGGLFETTAVIVIPYVCYKRFPEGRKSVLDSTSIKKCNVFSGYAQPRALTTSSSFSLMGRCWGHFSSHSPHFAQLDALSFSGMYIW